MSAQELESQKTEIVEGAERFARIFGDSLRSLAGLELKAAPAEYQGAGLSSGRNVFVSILFTGTVFGEFILALDEDTAGRIVSAATGEASPSRGDIADTLTELLNISVGESISTLRARYRKLTITTPKVVFGQTVFPRVRSAKVALACEAGGVECHLYVDHMMLDLAASYQEIMASLVTANDELTKALGKLKEQQAQLVQSEKLAALGTMAAGVAHEINTPLAVISIAESSMKNLLKQGNVDTALFGRMLDRIEVTIAHVSRITNALRAYATNAVNSPWERIRVSEVLDHALAHSPAGLAGVALDVSGVPADLEIECGLPLLSQLFQSLLTNARDAVESLPDRWIRVEARECGDSAEWIELCVTDSGRGIPEEVRARMFDPFYTTKPQGKGTGLGLSLARGIAEAHLGSISIDPLSVHTRVVVRLPKSRLVAGRSAA